MLQTYGRSDKHDRIEKNIDKSDIVSASLQILHIEWSTDVGMD